jgi:hypothetical protein
MRFILTSIGVLSLLASVASSQSHAPRSFRVTDDSLDGIPLWAPLGEFVRLRPGARDTVRYGEESAYPAIVFAFEGMIVLASQYRDSIDLSKPADSWTIRGSRALLPEGITLAATVGDLRYAYGRAIGHDDLDGWSLMFCAHPRFFFNVDTRNADIQRIEEIPGVWVIVELTILPYPPAGWLCRDS